MKNLRTKKFTRNETTISTATARVVIIPKQSMRVFIKASAATVAKAAAPKNIANSTYHMCLPGRKTNTLFISQQKTLATVKPAAVAKDASAPREACHVSAPENSTDGRPRNRTAQSSGVRHFRQVAARM